MDNNNNNVPKRKFKRKDTNRETSFESQRSLDTFGELSSRYQRNSVSSLVHARDRVWQSCQPKRERGRLIYKNGESNVSNIHVKKRHLRYLADIFTTLVDLKWRWILLMFIMTFILSWMWFALFWWLISLKHEDLVNLHTKDWKPCVNNVEDFTTALLFSIETQHTIGYGSRMITRECPDAIILMMIQSCCGVVIQAMMTGVVFAKLARSKKRAETLMFSKHAVICKRDGHLSLLFRVGDMRKSHIIQTTVRGVLIQKHVTQEGEVLPLAEHHVSISTESGSNNLLLIWPLILQHRIDKSSPFWNISPCQLHNQKFELVIILEGVIESTGLTTQARTSYLPSEIQWGHRFDRLVTFQKENGKYIIDYSRFHNTSQVICPPYSAKQMARMQQHDDNNNDEDGDYSGTESSIETTTIPSGILDSTRRSEQFLDFDRLSRISDVSTVPTLCRDYLAEMRVKCHVTSSSFVAPGVSGSGDHVIQDQKTNANTEL